MRPFLKAILILVLMTTVSPAAMNPNNPGFPLVDLYGKAYDNNAYSSLCVACHRRTPSFYTQDNNGLGSHFVYGGSAAKTQNTAPEKTDAWAGSDALSKYGKINDNVSVTGIPGELICESCHNTLRNMGVGKTVVTDNALTDPSPLCEGCHQKTGPGHHLLTGETGAVSGQPLNNTDDPAVRNPPVSGSEVTYPGPNAVNCRSCHKPHDAQTATGARILKRGYKSGSPPPGGAVQGVGVTDTGDPRIGVQRQFDVDPTGANRLVTDFTPLCDACHKASD